MKFIKKNWKILGIVLSIVLVIVAISTVTYAFYYHEDVAGNPSDYRTGTLTIDAKSKSSVISLDNAIPISDEEGKKTDPYVFTITNTGNLDYKFNVKLLSKTSGDGAVNPQNGTIDSQYIKLQIDDEDEVKTLQSFTKSDVTLKAGESIDIKIRVWLDINTKNDQINKTFNSQIVIDGQAVSSSDTSSSSFSYGCDSEGCADFSDNSNGNPEPVAPNSESSKDAGVTTTD